MERTDWLDEGFDSRQARFLMVTAITHHRFSSPLWGAGEVRKLHAELAEIEMAAARLATGSYGSAATRWSLLAENVSVRARGPREKELDR